MRSRARALLYRSILGFWYGSLILQPQSARIRPRVGSGAPRARSGRPANRALIWYLAVAIWVPVILIVVDFQRLGSPLDAPVTVADLAPNAASRIFKIALILIGAVVIFSHVREARAVLRQTNRFFLAFLVLALASVMWSADRDATLARYVSFIATVLVCFSFCLAGWHRKRLQNVLRPVMTLLMAGSLIYIAMAPEYAIDFDKAGYHGLAYQKNPFGELCAFGTLLWMHAWISGENKALKAILGAALGWTCLWLSKSSTSLLATAFASWLMFMMLRTSPSLRRYTPYMVTLFAGLVVAYALAVLQLVPGLATVLLGPITAITGKDMTFSNRAMIWDIIKEHVQLHPILGTGYGAYWTGAVPTSPSYVFLSRMYFWPSEAHNGYLDVVNDLGFVGLICLLGYLTVYVRQSLQLFKTDRPEGALYLAIFFQQAMTNLSESCWFSPMGILPVFVTTLATFTLAAALLDQQRARALQGGVKPQAQSAAPQMSLRSLRGARR
jgi:exopolysaccharide production protein ExoQ